MRNLTGKQKEYGDITLEKKRGNRQTRKRCLLCSGAKRKAQRNKDDFLEFRRFREFCLYGKQSCGK